MQNYINYSDNEYIREEMIDGKIYLMAPPTREHRTIQGNLQEIFNRHFKRNKKRCIAIFEDKIDTVGGGWVIPDLMVFCYNHSKDIPLIVIEVLSPSTRERDLGVKMEKYANLGIKEYWIVTWETFSIDIYLLSDDDNKYKLYKSYAYIKIVTPRKRNIETGKMEPAIKVIKQFSPVSVPDMKISLEDVFYFVE